MKIKSETIFKEVVEAPTIEMFYISKRFIEDTSDKKVNLSVGVYRTEEGNSWILPFVKQTEREICDDPNLNYDYLSILGLESFFDEATKLLLGPNSPHIKNKNAFGLQALSGTGGLRAGAEFLTRIMGLKTYYYSNPSWDNHPNIFNAAGFTDERTYRYWDEETKGLDFDGMIEDLRNAPENSVIILQVCGHNPTAVDPTKEQWMKIAEVFEEKKLFPFFDAAYHGFGSGEPDEDVFPVRYFADRGIEFFCSQSFAKNFGIYNVRCGAITIFSKDASRCAAILSQMALRVFFIYESPPAQGVRIVARILQNPKLKQEWLEALKFMTNRIKRMRQLLQDELIALETPGTWDFITKHRGMFTYLGLTEQQVEVLAAKYHVYILRCGRLNICGISEKNVKHVARAIYDVITMYQPEKNGLSEYISINNHK